MRVYKRDRKGRFARHGQAKARYKSAKKANARAHRARVKGSAKARGKEILTSAPRRSKQLVGGAALYGAGRYMGSARAQSLGLNMAQQGARAGVGRVGATRAMSKGLQRSRNRKAKDQYYREIGTTRARRNALKLAGAAVVAGAGLYAVKNGHIGAAGNFGKTYGAGEVFVGKSKRNVASIHYGPESYKTGGGVRVNAYGQIGKRYKKKAFVVNSRPVHTANW